MCREDWIAIQHNFINDSAFFFFFAIPCLLWDLSPLTRD